MESGVDKDTDLELVKGQFEDFCQATGDMRELAKKCRNYKDNKQWTDAEVKVLERRKQPVITDNKIQDKVDTLMGLEQQQRTDPKAFPRNPQDEGAAEAATDGLRYVADACDYQRSARKPATENLIIEGWCYGEVYYDKKSKKICMEQIRVDRGYHDIRSLRNDFEDKQYAGYFTWMDADEVKRKWKDKAAEIDGSFSGMESTADQDEHEDKPNRYTELRGKRKRLQVFTTYHMQDGVWMYSRWCKGGFLDAPVKCTYVDDEGQPMCAIEVQALYRDADGNCYGAVPRYLDLQDEHNKRRSKMLHLLNSKRLITQKGAFPDINKARAELHKPDGVLEYAGSIDQVRVEDNLNAAEGQWRLMQQTENALSQVGPNAAIQGLSGDLSGRAKQLDQASGSLQLMPLFDAIDAWEIRMYRQAWMRIRQFWAGPMWIRVTDDEQKLKFVGLNQPITAGEAAAETLKGMALPDEQKAAALQGIAQDPNSQQPHVVDGKPALRNSVASMDMDIIISRSADTVNIQAEQFEQLSKLAETRPEIPFSVILELSQVRSEVKRKVMDQVSGQNDPNAQAMQQMQQRMAALETALKEATVAKTVAETEKTQAQTAQIATETTRTGVEAASHLAQATRAPDLEATRPN